MKTSYIAGLIVILLVVTGVIVFILSGDTTDTVADTSTSTAAAPTNQSDNTNTRETDEKIYTEDEVAAHNTSQDCWTIINAVVYDITAYVPRHPGGNEILAACGTDGTNLFTNRTTDSGERVGSGSPHSTSASRQLESFRIGTKAQ